MRILKFLIVIPLAAASIILAHWHFGQSTPQAGRQGATDDTPVEVAVAASRPFFTRIEAIGTAHANESVDITATVTERVREVLFEDGDIVKAGDVLIRLEDDAEQAEVAEARVDLSEQQRELERMQGMFERQLVPRQDLDVHESATESAAARLAVSEARLEKRTLVAPFDGALGLRRISPGALVNPGTVITTLDDLSIIKVLFSVPETLLSELKTGQTIEAASVAWPGEAFTGVVATIDTRVEPATRAVMIQAHIANPDYRLRPGMLLTIELISRPREAIAIPEKAIISYGDQRFVFVLQPDNTVEQRVVEIGEREFGWVEVIDGLDEGETFVVEGLIRLRDGAAVQVAGQALAPDATPTPPPAGSEQ